MRAHRGFSADFRRAVKSNDFELVEQMLTSQARGGADGSGGGGKTYDLEQPDPDGVTLVMCCAMKGIV